MRRMLKWLGRAGIVLGICLLPVLVFVAEENLRGQLLLRQVLRRLHARNEPLTVAELHLPDFSRGENAGPAVLQAGEELAALAKANPIASEGPTGMMAWTAPGRATVRHRAPTYLAMHAKSVSFKDNKTPVYEWLQLEHELANAEAPLAKLRQALQQPVAAPVVDYGKEFGSAVPALPWNTFMWLAAAAIDALHTQNLEAATDNMVALVSIVRYQRRDVRMVSNISTAVVDAFMLPVVWEALQEDGWTDAQLLRIQSALAREQPLADALRTLELERTLTPSRFAAVRQSHNARLIAFRMEGHNFVNDLMSDNELQFPSEKVIWLRSILWRMAWSQQDEAQALDLWQNFLDHARELGREKSWTAFAKRDPKDEQPLQGFTLWRNSFSGLLGPQTGRLLLQKTVRSETGCQMMLAAIALKRYALRTGNAPPSLETLVPEFLSEIPTDWMDGKPLRYRGLDGKNFVLYSVGTDGQDDGGDPKPVPQSKYREMWAGRDTVWPAVAAN